MNIGIIIFSNTGNTNSVAVKIKNKLNESGYTAEIEKIEVNGNCKPGGEDFEFTNIPDPDKYEALIFGAQVMAFSLSPVMKKYLNSLADLKSMKTGLLITQQFPFAWMGGNRAVKQMRKICESKGAVICGSAIVNWGNSEIRKKKIKEALELFKSIF
jgi:flavodoxin